MFCTNCGKQIIDTARFCNYCGKKVVESDENQGGVSDIITENPAPYPADSDFNAENVENSGNLLKMTNPLPSFVPKMNESPKSGYSPDSVPVQPTHAEVQSGAVGAQQNAVSGGMNIPPMADPARNGVSPMMADPALTENGVLPEMGQPDAPQPERKYTLGHLIMCLAASAVMAIAAGIFAGLYFSVV